jgi:U2 small nuclear ribonucleoprotein A'
LTPAFLFDNEQDQECLDLTDNDIPALANFPLSPRLRTLLLARNRVAALAPNLAKQVPNLSTLVLTQNRLSELGDLEPLGGFSQLIHLVLVGNGVASKEVGCFSFVL